MEPDRSARTGLALRDALAWHDLVDIVETAEATGYDALFLPEIAGRETFATLAAVAGVTQHMALANGIAPIGNREPHVTAMAAATVQERSGGRMVLGLGTGSSFPGALTRLRSAVVTIRAILAGESVTLATGRTFRLTLDHGQGRIPIWISALGPKAMRLAGQVADGVLLNWCTPERVTFARNRIREGAEAAGRDPGSVSVGVYVRACLGPEEAIALPVLRRAAGEYASYPAYRRQFEAMGLGREAHAAAEASAAGTSEDVPEALLRALMLFGDPAVAARRFRAYREAGADMPIVYPIPVQEPASSIVGTLFALGPTAVIEP